MESLYRKKERGAHVLMAGWTKGATHRALRFCRMACCSIAAVLAFVFFLSRHTQTPALQLPRAPAPIPQPPPDYAEMEEAKSPLLAGHFEEAIRALTPLVKAYPGDPRFPYTLATIYFRQEESYEKGIPYALQACRDDSQDVRYRWLLRTLTLLAGHSEDSIPLDCRLATQTLPPSPVHFEDVAEDAGIRLVSMGRGAAWGDFDRDARDDLLICSERGPFRLFRNLGKGKFSEVAAKVGLVDPVGLGCYGASFADYDNDGFEDVLLTSNGWGGDNRLFLFHNESGRHFKDVTEQAGMGGQVDAFGLSWADYDRDGLLDVAVATGIVHPKGDRILLYHNLGHGKFSEVGVKAGLTMHARWMNVCWGDYDADGRPDLFAVSFDSGCALYHNLGRGRFENVTEAAGFRCPSANYTCDVLDYNNDGKPDIFVSTYPGGKESVMVAHYISGVPAPRDKRQLLFRNNGDGTFVRATEEAGITGWHEAMASGVGDIDDDGFPDILLGTGSPQLDWAEPKPLYHNDGNGHFVDIGLSAGILDFGMLHGTVFSDYDDSGRLSFFEARGGFYQASKLHARLYHNAGTSNHAFEARLIGTKSNRDAIGARLMLAAGDKRVYQVVDGGSGFGSMNSRTVHFGLGASQTIDSLTVDWPSGIHQVWQHPPIDTRIELVESKLGFRILTRFR